MLDLFAAHRSPRSLQMQVSRLTTKKLGITLKKVRHRPAKIFSKETSAAAVRDTNQEET
jgi:hypothetical protein